MEKIKVGISACLLGQEVRFDGGHKLDRWLRDVLGQYVEYVPVCPEVEVGLPTPRPALRLVGKDPEEARLVFSGSGEDITDRMVHWAKERVEQLADEELCGFIFKSKSPSSGMERVRLYDGNGMPNKNGVGLFAQAFMRRFPLVPVEEDGRLHDPKLKETFVEALFTFKRFREALAEGSKGALVDFHSRHKLLLMAHSPETCRKMGALMANLGQCRREDFLAEYEPMLMKTLHLRTTLKKNVDVLQHVLGYFKKQLTAEEKAEALDLFDQYRKGLAPLLVPVTLLNHYVRKYDQPYLKEQFYLNPHPLELKLRIAV